MIGFILCAGGWINTVNCGRLPASHQVKHIASRHGWQTASPGLTEIRGVHVSKEACLAGYLKGIAEVRVCKRVAVKIGHRQAFSNNDSLRGRDPFSFPGRGKVHHNYISVSFSVPLAVSATPPCDGEPLGLASQPAAQRWQRRRAERHRFSTADSVTSTQVRHISTHHEEEEDDASRHIYHINIYIFFNICEDAWVVRAQPLFCPVLLFWNPS